MSGEMQTVSNDLPVWPEPVIVSETWDVQLPDPY